VKRSSTRRRTGSSASSRPSEFANAPGGETSGVVARAEDQGVVVLGVVVVVGVVVEGAGAVVEGVGLPAPLARGIGDGEDCGAGAGPFPISETSALDGGGEAGAFAVDGAAAAGAPAGALGCVTFGRGLDAPVAPVVARVSAVIPTNPRANALMQAPTSAACRLRIPDRLPPAAPPTGGVLSSANDSRTVAGETGTSGAFRNPAVTKRRRVSGRRRARAAACSSWSDP
jgi:hypothetical protein